MTPLPFQPELPEFLRARYKMALDVPYDLRAVWAGEVLPPAQNRDHVFDFHDGLRFIFFREALPGDRTALCVSCVVRPGSDSALTAADLLERLPAADAMRVCEQAFRRRFQELSGDAGPLDWCGWSDAMVAHWERAE